MQKSEKKILFLSFVVSIILHVMLFSIFYFLNFKPPKEEKIITVSLDIPPTDETPSLTKKEVQISEKPLIQEEQPIKPPSPQQPQKHSQPEPQKTTSSTQTAQTTPQTNQSITSENTTHPQSQESPTQTQTQAQTQPQQSQKIDLSAGRQENIKPPPKKDEDIDGYLKELIKYLNQQARERDLYPPIAKRLKIEGQVVVRVSINEDGTIEENSMMIVESSGYNVLDKGALDILKKLQPLKKPPKRITVEIPIVFQIIYM